MSLNAYLEAAGSIGYTAGTTAGVANGFIPGRTGKRVSVLAYAVTTPSVATNVVFMNPVPGSGVNTIASALTASSTAIQWGSTRPSNISTSDWVAVMLDDQTFIFGQLTGTATTSTVGVSAGTMAAAAIGNPVYYFATSGNAGHYKRVLGTAQTQYSDSDANCGRFFGSVMGGPMVCQVGAPATTAGHSIDYISYGYMGV